MNRYFLNIRIYLALILCTHLYAYDIPHNYTLIECTIIPIAQDLDSPLVRHHHHDDLFPANYSHPHIPLEELLTYIAYSTNWSGYVAATNLSQPTAKSVSTVTGSWVVPSLKNSTGHTYCSIWVGIDGYHSSSVEQIGTEHDWYNGSQKDYAWFEMYPAGSYMISSFPVNPGDVITASVVYSGNNVFTLTLHNNTRKVSTIIPTSHTTSSTAQRKCAEWVVEAPYLNTILPLADFKTVYFTRCATTINNINKTLAPGYMATHTCRNDYH